MNDVELMHYGVKGMKWGVRRYQNPDGSLTPAGKKKASRQYRKAVARTNSSYQKQYQGMYYRAHNKAVDRMNGGEIDKFNKSQEKKYGKKFAEREGYFDDYDKLFNKILAENMNKQLSDFYNTDKYAKKTRAIVEKYGMLSWDDMAKKNEAAIEEIHRAVSKYK